MAKYNTDTILRIDTAAEAAAQRMRTDGNYVCLPFYSCGRPVASPDAPLWGMSLRKAGSMRFRWNETNENRSLFLSALCLTAGVQPVTLELIHSKDVYVLNNPADTDQKKADGMITVTRSLLPVITVADCMPIFLYDPVTGMFGALHSGWKGTGIAAAALEKAHAAFGTKPENVLVVLGPHIHACCYIVDEDRAAYFRDTFCADSVEPVNIKELQGSCKVPDWNAPGKKLFRLSLEKANIALLLKSGVLPEHIAAASDCTCCNELFGSFRRETAPLPLDFSVREKWLHFTVQAAFCGYIA